MDIFSKCDTGKTELVQMILIPQDNIKLLDQKPYMLHLKYHAWLRKEVKDLEKEGIIPPSTSNVASPLIIAPKKKVPSTHEVTYRKIVDYRKINEQIKNWFYALMRIDIIFSKLHGTKLFCTLDIRSGYYSITMANDSKNILLLQQSMENMSFFMFPLTCMYYFTLMIKETLEGLDFCFAYLDDIIIYPKMKKIYPTLDRYLTTCVKQTSN